MKKNERKIWSFIKKNFTLQLKALSMNEDYLKDLSEIKKMMQNSTKFLSLSGISGIIVGIYALIGAYCTHLLIERHDYAYVTLESFTFKAILGVAFLVLLASLLTALYFSYRKAKKSGEKLFTLAFRKAFWNFAIPLATGGVLVTLLLRNEYYGLLAPITLIFYGLACVNVSNYTFGNVRYLGIAEIILGLFSVEFSGFGLLFWVLGFGICNILYGVLMYFKYEKN